MKFKLSGIKNSKHIYKTMEAKNPQEAYDKAEILGITPVDIIPIESFSIQSFFPYEHELLLSFRQISFMLGSAIAIDEIFQQCITSCVHPKIKSMYQDILKSLLQGNSLSASFSKFVSIVGHLRVAMIEVGENSASLPEIFELLAKEIEQKQEESAEFKKKFFYPCMVFICTILAFGFLNAKVLPEFTRLFEEMSIELPFLTKALIFSGNFFSQWGIFILISLIFVGSVMKQIPQKSKIFREKFHRYFLKLPIFGKIFLYRDLHRYFLAFYFCEKAGLEIKLSLKNAYLSLKNEFLKAKFQEVSAWIEKGENLSNALCKIEILDVMSRGLIISGEKSGNLERMLQISSIHYKNLYSQNLERFNRWLEPIMSIFVGFLVLWFALGILTPMWNLNSAVL
ncbi:hypothetical protein BKH42_00980 [Helicobacter sp. 13S00482-2]|uniref:type II secretion system F family protein n=1 Tax=Helicobacter sp. 13S00482-2 TaxID=1476200 RepID=UPI000BA6EE48|nr:type II secretion system F family protein [Helicobacter sp. 13S00482-2]PAF54513.1 hypothetical protein BKH42_00980 [Helicobacter sp. 13S00482-2]